MKLMSKHKYALVSAAAVLMASVSPALADVDEVVVTAQKRVQSIQDVPISITALSGDDLDKRGLIDLSDVAETVPNFEMPVSNTSRNVSIRIRGIGSSGTNPGIEPSVGVFLDGIYQPTSAMAFGELGDIQSVEILRGPQGTLYGRNTPIGALNVTTRAPSSETEGQIRLGMGNAGQYWMNGYVGGELGENLSGRLVAYTRNLDGFEENAFTGEDVNGYEQSGFRGKLRYQPSEKLDVNVIASFSEQTKNCCIAEQIDPTGSDSIAQTPNVKPGTGQYDFLSVFNQNGRQFSNYDDSDHVVHAADKPNDATDNTSLSVQLDYTMANDLVLTSITSYQDWVNDTRIAHASLPIVLADVGQELDNSITSQELRITSPLGGKIDYLAGVYLYSQDTTFSSDITLLAEAETRTFASPNAPFCLPPAGCTVSVGDTNNSVFLQDTQSTAIFGTMTYHIDDQWDVTLGLRQSDDEKTASAVHGTDPNGSLAFNNLVFAGGTFPEEVRKDSALTYNLNTRYQLDDDIMLFATAATGFKSGGFNSRRLRPNSDWEFEEENSTSIEAGVKSYLLDRQLMLNATIYRSDVEDFQETALNDSGTGFIVNNAGDQRVQGLEMDFAYAANDNWLIEGSYATLDAEYTDFPDAECGIGETPDNPATKTCNRTGEQPGLTPEYSGSLAVQYDRPVSGGERMLRLRADYNFRAKQNLTRVTKDYLADVDALGLLNLRASLSQAEGNWTLEAYINNATDESYYVQAAKQPLGGLLGAGGYNGAAGMVGWYGQPRDVGIQLTRNF